MGTESPRILIVGWGNLDHLDDALGPALADAIDGLDLPGVAVEVTCTLSINHAAAAAAFDQVIFASAAKEGRAPFTFRTMTSTRCGLDSFEPRRLALRHLAPDDVLELARRTFRGNPQGYLMGIRGYAFEVGDAFTRQAHANLQRAVAFIEQTVMLSRTLSVEPAPRLHIVRDAPCVPRASRKRKTASQ